MHGHGHGMAYDYHASLVWTCKGFVGDGVIGANAAAEVEEGRKEERKELVKQQRWQRTKCRQRRQGCHTRTLWSRRSTRMHNHRYCKILPLVKWLRNKAIFFFLLSLLFLAFARLALTILMHSMKVAILFWWGFSVLRFSAAAAAAAADAAAASLSARTEAAAANFLATTDSRDRASERCELRSSL